VVPHTVPATWEVEIRRSRFKFYPDKVSKDPISKNNPGMVVLTCGPSYLEGGGRSIEFPGWPGKSRRPYLKTD
jgi:hypothetical protein